MSSQLSLMTVKYDTANDSYSGPIFTVVLAGKGNARYTRKKKKEENEKEVAYNLTIS